MPNSVTVEAHSNSVSIEPAGNSVTVEAIQVPTTYYFLSPYQIVAEHKGVAA